MPNIFIVLAALTDKLPSWKDVPKAHSRSEFHHTEHNVLNHLCLHREPLLDDRLRQAIAVETLFLTLFPPGSALRSSRRCASFNILRSSARVRGRQSFSTMSNALQAKPDPPSQRPPAALLWLAVTAAVAGISSSAVLVQGMAGEASALAIAAWRTAAAAAIQIGFGSSRENLRARHLVLMSLAGVLLAVHFFLWFKSLSMTTVLRSTVLVSTVPLWNGLLEGVMGKVRARRKFWVGNLVAILGIATMATQGVSSETMPLAINQGDVFATLAAVAWAAYMQIGKVVRTEVTVKTWQGIVCAFAALTLWPVALILKLKLWGFSMKTWALLAGTVIGPQLIGHQSLDYILKWLSASTVSTITLLEPIGAGALAAFFFGDYPTLVAILGASIALLGVWLAL